MTNRTLTLLFTDIVRSTEVLGHLAPSAAERLRAAHFAALREQIERRGGRVLKTLGDGIMAAFDAAGSAVEAAIAIQHATARGPQAYGQLALSIRIGIGSGDVCVHESDCFGNPVVEASRLCASAGAGQVLLSESTRLSAGSRRTLREHGSLSLKGLPEPITVWEAVWTPAEPPHVRAVLADDTLLVREGLARVLAANGIELLGEARDAEGLLRLVDELRPDIAIVDVRMPPTHTLEGIEAAEWIVARHPGTGVLLLSQDVQPQHAARLLEARPSGVGYLLKQRVIDTREFAETVRRVAAGDTTLEPTVSPCGPQIPLAMDPIDTGAV